MAGDHGIDGELRFDVDRQRFPARHYAAAWRAWAASAATRSAISVVGPHPNLRGLRPTVHPGSSRQIDQCPVQRIARGPRLPGFLPSFKIHVPVAPHNAAPVLYRYLRPSAVRSFGLGLDMLRGHR